MYTLYLIVLHLSIATVYCDAPRELKKYYSYENENIFEDWATHRYKVFGVTNDGRLCIDNCVDGTCITGWDYNTRKACRVLFNLTAPVYFTAKYKQNIPICLTRCGKFGYSAEWCLVTKDGYWDYCSSEIYDGYYKKVQLTIDGTYCTTPCKPYKGEYFCKDARGLLVPIKCDPNITVDYMPERTIYGDICVKKCEWYKRDTYFGWGVTNYGCKDINMRSVECAPPAQDVGSRIREMYDLLYSVEDQPHGGPYSFVHPYI